MSQTNTFSQRLNKIFFDVDVSAKSISLIDSLRKISKLHYKDNNTRQSDLMTSIDMNSENAWKSYQEFTFKESPLPNFQIDSGSIHVVLGGTDMYKDTIGKVLELSWNVEFGKKTEAVKYYEELKRSFGEVASSKKFEKEGKEGEIAYYFNHTKSNEKVQCVILYVGKSEVTNKYEINLSYMSDLKNMN